MTAFLTLITHGQTYPRMRMAKQPEKNLENDTLNSLKSLNNLKYWSATLLKVLSMTVKVLCCKLLWYVCLLLPPLWLHAQTLSSERHKFGYDIITDELHYPWGLAFLPDGRMLVTEKPGHLRLIQADGQLHPDPVDGLPKIRQHGQGGLLGIAVHPQFAQNQRVYFSYAEENQNGIGTAVAYGQLKGHRLHDVKVIFLLQPKTKTSQHFGSRLVFDREGYLFITLGDRGKRERAQKLDDHAGSVIRLHDDGLIPVDNPFIGQQGKKHGIYSYGHRNIQGASLHPDSGELWTHEHGPQGGDEINIIQSGLNYGWPDITYGVNYFIGTKIGEGTHKAGMEQPLYYWVPSIAPSGMTFYNGRLFPQWQGNLFIGSLKFRLLVRLEINNGKVIHEERLLKDEFGRIRDIRQGPDGALYLLTDERNGKLIRLRPA